MRRKTKIFITIVSFVLLGAGAYLLLSGARELIVPWWHQRQAAKIFRPTPPPAAPKPAVPAAPPALDHRLFRRGDTLARLSIPRLRGEWYVVEGSDEKDLRLGPGHLEGTAFPGEKGNCVIAGHRDTQFRVLKDIRKGDEIVLRTSVGESRYRVTGYDIVKPTDTRSLMNTPDGELNLVTCYPFYYLGHAPKRFIVHAELVGPEVASGE
jgi:sortase A